MMEPVTSAAVVPPAAPPLALRPSRAAYARAFRANLWIAIPLLLISIVRVGLNPWLLPVVVVVVLLSFGGVVLYFRNARVGYGGGRYRITNLFGSSRAFTAREVGTLITITALNSGSVAPTTPQLILTRPDGGKLLRLRGQTWEVEQFAALASDLIAHGVSNDAIREVITTSQLRTRYPRLIGWWEAHPIAFGLLVGLGILVVIIVIAIAIVAAGQPG